MKKINVYTNHFEPESFKINDIVNILSKDEEIHVVTQIPNYPKGSFYDGYGFFKKRREDRGNIKIRRLFVIPRGNSMLSLTLNYLSYICSSFIYSLFNKRNTTDLVFVYVTSPIFISWAAIRQAKHQGVPTVMYLLDLWPDNFFSITKVRSRFVRKQMERICINIYSEMDVIFISSLSFKKYLVSYGVDESKIHYLPQHEDINENAVTKKLSDSNVQIIFTGNVGHAQGLDLLVDIAQELKNRRSEKVIFKIVGNGSYKKDFVDIISEKKLEKYFSFHDAVPKSSLDHYYNMADFGLVILENDPILNDHLPAKVQGYMSNKLPIIAFATGETERVLTDSKAGFTIKRTSIGKMVDDLEEYVSISKEEYDELTVNAYEYCKNNYSLDNFIKELTNSFTSSGTNVND